MFLIDLHDAIYQGRRMRPFPIDARIGLLDSGGSIFSKGPHTRDLNWFECGQDPFEQFSTSSRSSLCENHASATYSSE